MYPSVDMQMKGNYSQLATYLENRFKASSSINTSDPNYIRDRKLLCEAYFVLKKYDKLFSCIDQLKIDLGDEAYLLRATAYIELGDYDKAIEAAEKQYEEFNKEEPVKIYGPAIQMYLAMKKGREMKILETLALAHGLKGNHDEAVKYVTMLENIIVPGSEAVTARQRMSLSDYQRIPSIVSAFYLKETSEHRLAKIYMAMSDYQKSLALSERNLTYSSIEGGRDTSNTLPWEFIYAKSLFETGHYNDAKKAYDELLKKPQTKDNGEVYWVLLYDRGKIAENEGNLKDAEDLYAKSIEVIEQQRFTINTEVGKIGFVGDKQTVYHNMIKVLFQTKQYESAFEYVERAKSRALVDVLAAKKDFALKKGNEQDIRNALAMNDSTEYQLIMQGETVTDKNKIRSLLIKAREDLKAKSPELASLVTVTFRPITDLQSLIPKEEALIEYYYRDNDMYAFILSDGTLKTVKLDSKGLADDVQAFRKLIDTPSSAPFMDTSRKLYKRLFQPLESSLNKKNLIIVSHGVLHYLPMNALHDGNSYLIDRYSIRMMPSTSAMKYLEQGKKAKMGGVLIFGNPDLSDTKYDLEYAQKEATEIARIRPQSKVLVRKEATEEALRNYGKDYGYIHFATHGQFNPDTPLKSALLLAPAAKYNGMLTADKLYSLNLDTDLVTLSACETGMSKIASGDDLVGLTRGFLYAGSNSIVASLWKVDDLATSQLMALFYTELDKSNKREALRAAQIETKKKYSHPYYWASFQLTGSAN